jgi:hypothetical protein
MLNWGPGRGQHNNKQPSEKREKKKIDYREINTYRMCDSSTKAFSNNLASKKFNARHNKALHTRY